MSASPFQVSLSPQDIAQAQALVNQLYSPVIPFLESSDPNVQFFGALTIQVKIARDWDAFPQEHAITLRDTLLELTGRAATRNLPPVITRKLFVSVCSLALRLAPTDREHPESRWPNWILGTAQTLSANGASPGVVLEFLTIVAEEVGRSDWSQRKSKFAYAMHIPPWALVICQYGGSQMDLILRDAAPAVVQAASSSFGTHGRTALKCLEAWISWGIPADNITPLIPLLIDLLSPNSDEDNFVAASDVLQEILTKSSLSEGGAGLRTLTLPLLEWVSRVGIEIMNQAVASEDSGAVSHSVCKLITALGEHSTQYLAAHLNETNVQKFMEVALGYTGFPGWYGVDEEESEMVLPFWYLLEEALLDADYVGDQNGELWGVAKAIYLQLVRILQRKVTWPAEPGWPKDQREKFSNYRRDVGDALINAYYVLRDEMLRELVDPLVERLVNEPVDWESVEATLHNIKAIQEALPVDPNPSLATLFGPRVLGRLPRAGTHRVRRTALATVGAYATWFTTGARTRASTPAGDDSDRVGPQTAAANGANLAVPSTNAGEGASLLLDAVGYVVAALEEPAVCGDAARALKELCDANRVRLAPHIQSFGELHQRLPRIPANEKGKVLQSIASVIQALPPAQAIDPILVIFSFLFAVASPPEAIRDATIAHLGALTACSKGLTRSTDIFTFALEDPDTPEGQALLLSIEQARSDSRMTLLREEIVRLIGTIMARWCVDAEVSTAVSELIKSITALPSDATLLSLSPEPLLELVCTAARVQLTAVWLSLAALLVVQLDPPMWPRLNKESDVEVQRRTGIVAQATTQDFFGYLTKVGGHFPRVILEMSGDIADGLFRITATALTLQERYSLVNACNFMTMFLRKTRNDSALVAPADAQLRKQGAILMEALLLGIGGSAPRSTVPNLAELLSNLVSRVPNEARTWMGSVLMADNPSNAKIPAAAREKFMKAVLGYVDTGFVEEITADVAANRTRSTKKTKEAANEYALVARGLEGSAFGYATSAPGSWLDWTQSSSFSCRVYGGEPVGRLSGSFSAAYSNTEELYDDPIKLGILPEDSVMGLFYSFHSTLNPVIALLDPTLHTPIYVRRRSRLLYTAILAAACRFFKPSHFKPVHDLAQLLLGRALSDGISSVEYIQALLIMTYWKEAEDKSTFRKLGLAIRMAFELNLHHARAEPLPVNELQARERLNEERTWFRECASDMVFFLLRLMVWDSFRHFRACCLRSGNQPSTREAPNDTRRAFSTRRATMAQKPCQVSCNADIVIVTSLEMMSHYNLFRSIRSVVTPLNRVQFEPFIRHVISGGEKFLDGWRFETVDPTISPISKSFLRFYHMRMRLALAELKLVLVYNPLPGATHILLLDCVSAALALLRHITTEFAPNGYLAYGQDIVPFATAYAGAWLFKNLPRFDEQLQNTTLEAFRSLSNACRLQPPTPGNAPLYYAKFFEHLSKHASLQINSVANPASASMPSASLDLTLDMSQMLPHVPLPEDMNHTCLQDYGDGGTKELGEQFELQRAVLSVNLNKAEWAWSLWG
ncbi:Myb protein 1A [Rhizoctonia solani]|uniref:Myb protein 1A n=1 Tax=Rhizoctonia solani TaxID=456999 RepID=A0A8H8P831_9AGAM|nr:Myb protein 1A [Rhizoctonia solani]QRW26295.1 Myb protein 1A [Rhizoctonia solani]